MDLPSQRSPSDDCAGCRDAGEGCTGCGCYRMTGSGAAVGEALVRLSDLGWRIHTEQVEEAQDVWRVQVTRPQLRAARRP